YPPSVFALLPKILERSGTSDKGTITALYTVLVEGDDENEPVADTVRGILDGHIWLSRDLAARGHYPAIDVGRSISRVMSQVTSPAHRTSATHLRETLATYKDAEEMINIGSYVEGANPRIDAARRLIEPVRAFLRQGVHEQSTMDTTTQALEEIFVDEAL
ncbi:MAG: EscN/YscN/HrcN family type III secretion system ATPase, partial [Armatimonadota bacterium]|nr:EscN/YscN/HrcN family type III secretion system ATPase [Armatimonadota bacterium]